MPTTGIRAHKNNCWVLASAKSSLSRIPISTLGTAWRAQRRLRYSQFLADESNVCPNPMLLPLPAHLPWLTLPDFGPPQPPPPAVAGILGLASAPGQQLVRVSRPADIVACPRRSLLSSG